MKLIDYAATRSLSPKIEMPSAIEFKNQYTGEVARFELQGDPSALVPALYFSDKAAPLWAREAMEQFLAMAYGIQL